MAGLHYISYFGDLGGQSVAPVAWRFWVGLQVPQAYSSLAGRHDRGGHRCGDGSRIGGLYRLQLSS